MILAPACRHLSHFPGWSSPHHGGAIRVRSVAEIPPTDAAQVVPDTRALSVIRRKYRTRNQILLLITDFGESCFRPASMLRQRSPNSFSSKHLSAPIFRH